MTAFLVIIVVLAALVVAFLSIYMRLVALGNAGGRAWSDLEVQLNRRYGLIPNLVETVRGSATHERQTLERVAEARTRAMQSSTPGEKSRAEGVLQSTLSALFALAGSYPELGADDKFLSLQNELIDIEDQIQLARRSYNAVVREHNNRIETFPTIVVANFMSIHKREYFELEAPER